MALLITLAGCSGEEKEENAQDKPLQVVVAATYVSDEMLTGLQEELSKVSSVSDITVTAVSMGDTQSDPMGAMAGMTKLGAMFSSKEVDILITDADIARRFGDNGDSFVPMNDTFTSDEIESFSSGLVCIAIVDDEGEITSQLSAPCGAKLSESACQVIGLSNMQMFIVTGTERMDAAKTVFTHLATIK